MGIFGEAGMNKAEAGFRSERINKVAMGGRSVRVWKRERVRNDKDLRAGAWGGRGA
jgi:hypothetical protein